LDINNDDGYPTDTSKVNVMLPCHDQRRTFDCALFDLAGADNFIFRTLDLSIACGLPTVGDDNSRLRLLIHREKFLIL
jgi:hypothetical protein